MGEVEGTISIGDLPNHHSFTASLGFTKVPTATSPFPQDDPGAPFHKRDRVLTIKEPGDPEAQPLTFHTKQPVGHYYIVLRVMLAREIRGKIGIQIENFSLSEAPAIVSTKATMQVRGSVTWPSVPDDELHSYGPVEELS